MAESPAFNQVVYTSASPDEIGRIFSGVRAPGWEGPIGPTPNRATWSRSYMSTAVLIVGLILLLTTLIGGLVLLIRNQESLAVTIVDEGHRRKVIVSGAADVALSAAIFSAFHQLPAETATAVSTAIAQVAAPVAPAAVDPTDSKICPQCAEPVRAAAKVCRFCGYNFEPAT